jgi:hypothetical protein
LTNIILEKKNYEGKHCSNPQCFGRKATVFSPHNLALLYKDNFEKNHNKKTKKKAKWGNTAAIHNILKKKNYKAKFSTSSILKK